MATVNTTITKDWTKVAETADDPVLISRASHPGDIEFALTATDAAPTGIEGHRLNPEEALTRTVAGEGYIWMKVGSGSRNDSTVVIVTK